MPANMLSIRRSGLFEPEPAAELALEVVLGQLARLELSQQRQRLGVLPEEVA